jgi:nitroimidazol reductase NimA-like FMN-containing flavoprotein (pyridoxamine 5'-phosphate oxidase superfamily)
MTRYENAQPAEVIRRLLHDQPYAVLCTQGQSQPYGSLIAFAITEDLRTLVFATPVETRKYRFLLECDRVAVVVDSRSTTTHDVMGIEAVTAVGRASVVAAGAEFEQLVALLIQRHPLLADFVHAESSALFRVQMAEYLYVSRFQDVQRWSP